MKLKRKVIGIDIDIRKHNREKIEKHFLADKIEMIEASSVEIKIHLIRLSPYPKIILKYLSYIG